MDMELKLSWSGVGAPDTLHMYQHVHMRIHVHRKSLELHFNFTGTPRTCSKQTPFTVQWSNIVELPKWNCGTCGVLNEEMDTTPFCTVSAYLNYSLIT